MEISPSLKAKHGMSVSVPFGSWSRTDHSSRGLHISGYDSG